MPQIVESVFTKWKFDETEIFHAYILSDLQIKAVQNEIAIAAEERSTMAVSPEMPLEVYIREQEYMRGKIEALQYMLIMDASMRDTQRKVVERELHEKQVQEELERMRGAARSETSF